jgi:hypothetical protein
MAERCEFAVLINDGRDKLLVNGYKFNEYVNLYKEPDTNKWVGYHVATDMNLASEKVGRFKKKRAALAFLTELCEHMPMTFKSVDEFNEFDDNMIKEALSLAQRKGLSLD